MHPPQIPLTKCLCSRGRGLTGLVAVVVLGADEAGLTVVVPVAELSALLAENGQADSVT